MGYRLKINFNNRKSILLNDVFETEEDAKAELDFWLDSWDVSKEKSMMAGKSFYYADIKDYEIFKE